MLSNLTEHQSHSKKKKMLSVSDYENPTFIHSRDKLKVQDDDTKALLFS